MESIPAIVENCLSNGVATADAIVPGLAPGRFAVTSIVGKSTFGRSLTGRRRYPATPKRSIASITSVVMMGRRIKISDIFISAKPFLLRQVAYRQAQISRDTEKEYRQHHERCHDGPAYKDLGYIHQREAFSPSAGAAAAPGPAGLPFISTFAPGVSWSCPSVTTRTPGSRPFPITDSLPMVLLTTTGRTSAVPSAFTTKTYSPP